MTENEFQISFWQSRDSGRQLRDRTGKRLVYKIADALEAQARTCREQGRPDRSSRLLWIAGRVRNAGQVTKGAARRADRDIAVVRKKLIDDISESGI